jgi:hypothetical protein
VLNGDHRQRALAGVAGRASKVLAGRPATSYESASRPARQLLSGADGAFDVPGTFLKVGDVDSGLELKADRDPAGGQVRHEAGQEARVEVSGQVAGFLGPGDRVDLGTGEGDAGRAGLAAGAFQPLRC